MCIIDTSAEDQQTFSQRIPFSPLAEVLTDEEIGERNGVRYIFPDGGGHE